VRPRDVLVKAGEFLLFVVLFLAALWVALFLVKLSGWWPWFENAPDGQWAAVTLPALAVLVIAVAFAHDRILRKAGARPAEPAAVTVGKALREMAVQTGQGLLFAALFLPWFAVWLVLVQVTGVRAKLYQNMPLSVVVMGGGMVLSAVAAWLCWRWIMGKLRARGRPPETQQGG
jgi:hypothetical protein